MKYCSRCGAEVSIQTPEDDNRERWVCDRCDTIHYQNPLPVVGCIVESDDKVLLCKRSIEPRYGYWTVPAGFMELGESLAEGAAHEVGWRRGDGTMLRWTAAGIAALLTLIVACGAP